MFGFVVEGVNMGLEFTKFALEPLSFFEDLFLFLFGKFDHVFLSQYLAISNGDHAKSHRFFFEAEPPYFRLFFNLLEQGLFFILPVLHNVCPRFEVFGAFEDVGNIPAKGIEQVCHGLLESSTLGRGEAQALRTGRLTKIVDVTPVWWRGSDFGQALNDGLNNRPLSRSRGSRSINIKPMAFHA